MSICYHKERKQNEQFHQMNVTERLHMSTVRKRGRSEMYKSFHYTIYCKKNPENNFKDIKEKRFVKNRSKPVS